MASKHTRRAFLQSNVLPPDPAFTPTGTLFPTNLSGATTHGNAGAKFIMADPNAIEQLATLTDQQGYARSDQRYAQDYTAPLSQGRGYAINSAANNLAGNTDQNLQGALDQSGLGDLSFGQGEYNQARNMGIPIAAKESRDRFYFSKLLANNPQRYFGLNSKNIAEIALANTNGQNVAKQNAFGSRLNQYTSALQQQGQNQAAIIGGIGSLASAVVRNPTVSGYLSPSGYGNTQPYISSSTTPDSGRGI